MNYEQPIDYEELNNQNSRDSVSFLFSAFYIPKIPANQRVGPHSRQIYSLITGSLLADGYGERHGQGTRFHLHYSHRNVEYLMYLHKLFSDQGYCTDKKPVLYKTIGKNNKIYFALRFRTYTFTSFNPLYEEWYLNPNPIRNTSGVHSTILGRTMFDTSVCGADLGQADFGKKKRLPSNLEQMLTPLAVAVWIIDHGTFTGWGVKIATDCFTKDEVFFLAQLLKEKYMLSTSVQSQKNSWRIYIQKASMKALNYIVAPYVVPSMRYKLGCSLFTTNGLILFI